MRIVITSGYFNPIHVGHIELLKESKKLAGDDGKLIVIVNNDNQVRIKGSKEFMHEDERIEIVKAIKYVDEVMLSIDRDITVKMSLGNIASRHYGDDIIFAKGGDRRDDNSMPFTELEVCKMHDVKIIYGVGGTDKKNSSSDLLRRIK